MIRKKIKWDYIVICIIRILFIMEFFAPLIIWAYYYLNHIHHVDSDIKFINMLTAAVGLSLTFIPKAVERINKLKFSTYLSFIIILFIFCAEFCGELNDFYDKFVWWDKMLHTISGIILTLIGFMILFVLNESSNPNVQLSPIFICIFAFCFALSCGAVWEIFEFSGDRLFHMNMQKYLPPAGVTTLYGKGWQYDAGLIDTMTDIIFDAIGSFITSIGSYVALKIRAHKLGKKTFKVVTEKEFMDALTHGKNYYTKL